MITVLSRAGLWLAVLLVAVMAAAAAADTGFAVHMAIIAAAAGLSLWVSVSRADYGAIARGIIRAPEDPGRYDDDPIRWGMIATVFWGMAGFLAGLFIALLIVPRAVRLLREATAVLMEFTPEGLDLDDVRAHILSLDHVEDVHDLHASTVATGLPTISAHVVVDDACFRDGHALEITERVRSCVAHHFPVSVEHSTFQLETAALRDREAHGHA